MSAETKKEDKTSFSTQELLSMNMDRLKGYMEKWAREEDGGGKKGGSQRRKSQRLTSVKAGKKVLAVIPDPLRLSHLDRANDKLPLALRYSLNLCQHYRKAVDQLVENDFQGLIVAEEGQIAPQSGVTVPGLDFIMILKSIMPRTDSAFLLRKQVFLKEFVPGVTKEEKLMNFKLAKQEARDLPILFLTNDLEGFASVTASRINNVKSVPAPTSDFNLLFSKLSEALK